RVRTFCPPTSFFQGSGAPRDLHSFPTRRSSDLLVEFNAGDRVVRFQEWKGSESRDGTGWSVPVIYDPADLSFAMIDRGSWNWLRSEEHTSELQSRRDLVCRLLLEKKKNCPRGRN